ncbi:hypothetical protein PGH46_17525 [Legionella pneumophila]|nr:hypothetical protein PGH46_17525 [Legionella pneumophila]
MNSNHIKRLCQHFNLGDPTQEPQRVSGGLLHIMWQLNTDKGSFAIKQLSKDINLTDYHVIRNYELSENIASGFIALGIPAVTAIEKSGKHLFIINETGFLVYPWVNAKALDKDAVSVLKLWKLLGFYLRCISSICSARKLKKQNLIFMKGAKL